MSGKKGMTHYGRQIVAKVLALQSQGLTKREIGARFGLNAEQIKGVLKYYRRNEAQRAAGIEPKPKGRPRIRNLSEAQRCEQRIKELEREVALLKSFLQAAGRR